MHPDSLKEFRAAVSQTIDTGVKRVGEAKLLESFPGVKTMKALKALDAPRLFAGVIRRKAFDPSTKKSLANTKFDVFGHVAEGDDTAPRHLPLKDEIGRIGHRAVECGHSSEKAVPTWKMAIPEEFAGPMRQGGGPGNLAAINVKAMRVEPLGHVLDGESGALILYRTSMPAGDSSISKLAVMPLISRDPAFEAVRTDNLPEMKALLESRLGIRSTTAPGGNMAPRSRRQGDPVRWPKRRLASRGHRRKPRLGKPSRPTEARPRAGFLKD